MSPTRSSVLELDYMRGRGRDWIYPQKPYSGEGVLATNQEAIERFLRKYGTTFNEDPGSPKRTKEQVHLLSTGITLRAVYEDLLVPTTAAGEDLLDHIHVLLQIERELERKDGLEKNPIAQCDVFLMSKGEERKRSINKQGAIKALLQGSNERTGYPGDRDIVDPQRVSVQVHMLLIVREDEESGNKSHPVARHVPCVAVTMPERMRGDIVAESFG